MNEAETRADYIDPALKSAGWGVAEGSKIFRGYPITLGRGIRWGQPLTNDRHPVLYHRSGCLEAIWGCPKSKSRSRCVIRVAPVFLRVVQSGRLSGI